MIRIDISQETAKRLFDQIIKTAPEEQWFTWMSVNMSADFGDWEALEETEHPKYPKIPMLLRDTSTMSATDSYLFSQLHPGDAGYVGSTSLDYVSKDLAPTGAGEVDRRLKRGDVLISSTGERYRVAEIVISSGRSRTIALLYRESKADTQGS